MKLPLEGTSLEARQQSVTESQRDGRPLAVVGILNSAHTNFSHITYIYFFFFGKSRSFAPTRMRITAKIILSVLSSRRLSRKNPSATPMRP